MQHFMLQCTCTFASLRAPSFWYIMIMHDSLWYLTHASSPGIPMMSPSACSVLAISQRSWGLPPGIALARWWLTSTQVSFSQSLTEAPGLILTLYIPGIGYFTLPYLVHAKADHVFACEWNPHAVEALGRNLELNKVQDRCTVLPGDNQLVSAWKLQWSSFRVEGNFEILSFRPAPKV